MTKFLLKKGVDPEKRNVKGVSVLEHISQDVQISRDGRSQRIKSSIIEFLQNYITTTKAEKEGLVKKKLFSIGGLSIENHVFSSTDLVTLYQASPTIFDIDKKQCKCVQ